MTIEQTEPLEDSWYGTDDTRPAVAVLTALERYRAADAALRGRTRASMRMNETDVRAIRLLVNADVDGVSPRDLAKRLDISSASTTILLDRLERSGHVERRPHATDRRSIVVVPTPKARADAVATLGLVDDRMLAVAESLDESSARTIAAFLQRLAAALDGTTSE